jgi:hypothetical protein
MSVTGNITNNGTWNSSWLDLRSSQTRTIDGTNVIQSNITLYDDFTILDNPIFAGSINFNGHTLNIGSSDTITFGNTSGSGAVTGGGDIIINGSGAGPLNANNSKLYFKGSFIGVATSTNQVIFEDGATFGNSNCEGAEINANVIIEGTSTVAVAGHSTINGSLLVEPNAILQNAPDYRTLTVNGDVVNNGTIRDNATYNWLKLTMSVTGNITNNGVWNNTPTLLTWPAVFGATEYLFNISTDNNNWPSPIATANTYYNISSLVSSSRYWRVRADLGNGLYSPWSSIKRINAGTFGGFVFNTINSSQQMATRPINLTISAVDINGNPDNYSGSIALSASNDGTTTPSTISMTNGSWTGTSTISTFGDNVTLTATGGGESGTSNTFNLKKKPVIIVPGIVGTRLRASTSPYQEIWPDVANMILSSSDDYLDELILNNDGWPATSSVVTT